MAEDEFAQYRRGGAKPAAEADDFAQYKRAAPAEAAPQGSPEISPLKTFIGKAGEAIPFLPQIGAAISAGIQDPSHFREKYLSERQGAQAQTAAGAAQNPNAALAGTAAGIAGPIAATGGLGALRSLPGAIAGAAKGLLSPAALSKEALLAAAKAAPAGALAGLGLGGADVTAAQGDLGGAARQALGDAETGAATGALLGAGAGARGRQLGQAAEVAGTRAAQSQALDELATARQGAAEQLRTARGARSTQVEQIRAEYTGKVEALKADRAGKVAAAKEQAAARTTALREAAAAKATAPTRERAVTLFGLEKQQTRLGVDRTREIAQRLYDDPVAQQVLQLPPVEARAAAGKLRQSAGEQLGSVREQLDAIPQAQRQLRPILKQLTEIGPKVPNAAEKEAISQVGQILEAYAPNASITPGALRSAVEDIYAAGKGAKGTVGKIYRDAYELATSVEKGLIAEHLPGELPRYKQLLGAYGDARALEQGAIDKLGRVDRSQPAVRFGAPGAVARVQPEAIPPLQLPGQPALPPKVIPPPKPQYAGPGTLADAKAVVKPQLSAGARVGRAVVPALGATLGGGLGFAAGGGGPVGFALSSGGGTFGGRLGASLAKQWFQAVRPTTAGLQEVSTAAAEAVARHAGTLQAALRSGPTAANAVHRALMASDPDYKEAFKAQASGSVAPIDLSQFQSAWRKPQ